ncbi:efflux RND transporter periplasmic adaptor subunit [Flavobacterium sediminis]|uniref:Efflux RND transporter periplasmic adaptor subunit n=1 Tax=Flavobacterium sediminis TaxID=2201181 RepID=A0A2U8QWR2_9FLAO|nr:efflux RND transporter periplasmic adaptor subunit [Flavobacterium sediminis]AWM14608.1 efflux RND transporter periplasmic adaptor subunit [Flavobacterium sediminis]
MKKISIYIVLVAVGLVLGWLLFGNKEANKESSPVTAQEAKKQMWTCSMHPQIMKTEPGKCPICGMDLIPVDHDHQGGLSKEQFKLTENALALANVQTTIVGNSGGKSNVLIVSGKISENEEANAVQASYFSGRIERLHINFTGEEVKAGQALATIYSPELVKAQQELITAASLKSTQPELYKAVRNKLKLLKLSDSQINQIESSGKVKEYFPIYATVSGTVSEKLAEQGDYVKQGQPLFKISDLNSVWANFDVYENQISNFKVGQAIVITTEAYPTEVFKAKIAFIDPVLNPDTRVVKMRAVIDNKDRKLKPSMFVKGKTDRVSHSKETLTVPATAVLWTGKRSIVYIKPKPDEPVFEMREVLLGQKTGEDYEITGGLQAGEEIVTNGVFTIDASAQLQGKKSMMNRKEEPNGSVNVPTEFKNQLQVVYDRYIALKDALINSDSKQAKQLASAIEKAIAAVDMKLVPNEATHKQWMAIDHAITESAVVITKSSDIEEQRKVFKKMSNQLILAVQNFGINTTTYKLYCPMADSDSGAYWLSNEGKVLNPYFGDKMLKCGEVKEKINNK